MHVSPEMSNAIRVARVLCILFVVYPHIPPYGAYDVTGGGWQTLFWLVNVTLGLNAVPLLSVVSGFLCYRVSLSKPYGSLISNKVKVLIVPMCAWNLISILKDPLLGVSMDISEIHNSIFSIYATPAITPLYFLRDVFVCFLCLPAFAKRNWIFSCGILLLVLANSVFKFDGHLFISSFIPLFFFLGFMIARFLKDADLLHLSGCRSIATSLVFLCLGVVVVEFLPLNDVLNNSILVWNRFFGALFMWGVSVNISLHYRGGAIFRMEKSIFIMFCAHTLIIGLYWRVLKGFGLDYWNLIHFLVFVTTPIVVATAAFLIDVGLKRFVPYFRFILAGSR